MAVVTGVVAKQDLLTEISQHRVQQAKATYERELSSQEVVDYARTLLTQIVSLVEADQTTYDICTARIKDQFNLSTRFRDKLSLGWDLVMRYEPLGKLGLKVGNDVYLWQLDPSYNPKEHKKHSDSKLLQALDYLEEIGFVRIRTAALSTYTKNQKDQFSYVPYAVAPTKQGKAYIHTLKEQS